MLSMARIPPLRYKLVYLLTLIYLAAVAGIGMRIYRDFGAPWDEPAEIERGIANYERLLPREYRSTTKQALPYAGGLR
jgi:hypothetical protein